ncbi:hypothetical protein ACLOJK_032600 [Asimina triloba]
MAPRLLLLLLLLLLTALFTTVFSDTPGGNMYPLACSEETSKPCESLLYHMSAGLQTAEIASLYSVKTSQIAPIYRGTQLDYLISVPCSCNNVDGINSYFYNTVYNVSQNDTFANVSDRYYSGQAWMDASQRSLTAGTLTTIHLLCGCLRDDSQVAMITYTVQNGDTTSGIASFLNSSIAGIQRFNGRLVQDPSSIFVGWVLFVPMGRFALQSSQKGGTSKRLIIISILVPVAFLLAVSSGLFISWRNRSSVPKAKDPKMVSKTLSARNLASLQSQYLTGENMEGVCLFIGGVPKAAGVELSIYIIRNAYDAQVSGYGIHTRISISLEIGADVRVLESERPKIYGLDEIEEATLNFDETRKLGEGGYGSVYFGILEEQEVAIKKMKSSKSKEFFAEVELIGFASGDDHLYLVYEYVRNGSLNDHLHDPLLKGNQPLTWNARAQIALDAARGIEYIHDHTKARYVHRDIKTSNILLDDGLRAKDNQAID